MSDENAKLEFRPISSYIRKVRKTRTQVVRISARWFIDGQMQKGLRYFVRCEAHQETSGPYATTALADHAMAHPNEWCKWCAPFFRDDPKSLKVEIV